MDQLNKKRILFVTNPFSGAKSKDHLRQTIETYLDHAVFEYDIQYTEYPSHATTIASDAASNGLFAVIAVGGDGTINDEVLGTAGETTGLTNIPLSSAILVNWNVL